MTEPEVLAAASNVTGHTVGCMCQRCDEAREVAAWGALVDRVMDEWDKADSPRDSERHASPRCACGVNDAGQRYVDPICLHQETNR